MNKTKEVLSKVRYKKIVYTCGFVKSVVSGILGFAVLLIFNNLMMVLDFPLTPEAQMLFGVLILIISTSIILIFDGKKLKAKEEELDEIFKEINKQWQKVIKKDKKRYIQY